MDYDNTFAKIQGGNCGGYILWLPHFTHTTCDLDFADLHANFKIGKGIVMRQTFEMSCLNTETQ
jgi:hypothetical protein